MPEPCTRHDWSAAPARHRGSARRETPAHDSCDADGVRGRLFMAFAGVAMLSVAASVGGWHAYIRLAESLTEMTGHHLPALAVSIRLAEQGSAIMATAPVLAAATSEKEEDAVASDLERRLDALRTASRELTGDAEAEMRGLIGALTANSTALAEKVRERLRLAAANIEEMQRLKWLHADFLDEVEPLTVDTGFNMNSALEALEEAEKPGTPRLLETLRNDAPRTLRSFS